jgi:VanZ family protein
LKHVGRSFLVDRVSFLGLREAKVVNSMFLSRQQKLTIIALVFYWLALFIFAHMPIPELVRKADVSDKGLHMLAYLILTFLFWSAIKHNKKVNWRKATVWLVLLVVVLYSVLDEVLQGFVQGRSCDAMDFVADLTGTLTGLIVLSIFTFWPACLVVTGITIFGLTNISRVNITELLPMAKIAFLFLSYTFFTLLWIRYIHHFLLPGTQKLKWLIIASIPPLSFLLAVKLGSLILGRSFTIIDFLVSVVGIVAVVGISFLIVFFRR